MIAYSAQDIISAPSAQAFLPVNSRIAVPRHLVLRQWDSSLDAHVKPVDV